nr:hypothetical protein [uncultured Mediterranean phage uvMED]
MLKASINDELASIDELVANAFKNWRNNYAKVSQQNLHDLCKAYDIPVYNSQIAYLERSNLDAKRGFYYGLEYMNKEFATKNNKFLKIKNKTLRDKLINAEPFLTFDNKVADRGDFALILLNKQDINKKYLSSNTVSINDEIAKRYTELVIKEFHRVRDELMLSRPEMVEAMLNTKSGKKVTENHVDRFKKIIMGDYVFTGKDLTDSIQEYGTIPCFGCIDEIKPSIALQKFCKEMGINN